MIHFLLILVDVLRIIIIQINSFDMNGTSMEKRSAHADKAYLSRSRRFPQSTTSIALPIALPVKKDRREDNMKPFKTQNLDSSTLQSRYQSLQKLYKNLLIKMSQQNQNIEQQSIQLEALNKIHENNEKQISKLRGRLGFLQKNEKSTQTYNYQQQHNPELRVCLNTRSCINIWKGSKSNSKIMSSVNITHHEPEAGMQSPSNSKTLNKFNKNGMKVSRSSKYFMDENTQGVRKDRNLSPNIREKFRFMPTLRLH